MYSGKVTQWNTSEQNPCWGLVWLEVFGLSGQVG